MKKIFICLISIFAFTCNMAQTLVLKWEKSSTVDYGSQKIVYPYFSNEGYSPEGNNVYIYLKNKNSGKNVTVNNFKWEKVGSDKLYEISPFSLPYKEVSSVNYYTDDSGVNQTNISVATFKRDSNNNIYRLSSFDVVPETSNQNKKSTPVNARYGITENPLKEGSFYKIKVDRSGIFKITAKFLKDNGINPSSINPKNFRIYGNGGVMLSEYNMDARYDALQENAIQVIGEDDGVWNDGDYALFYAQGPDGYNLYDTTNGKGFKRTETRIDDSPNHLKNIYEDYSYYFINFDKGPGKRVQNLDNDLPPNLITRYDDYQFINDEKTNPMSIGRVWVGDNISTDKTVIFKTKSPISPTDQILYRTQIVGYRAQQNTIKIDVNGQTYTQTYSANDAEYRVARTFGKITNQQGNEIKFTYSPNYTANPNAAMFFDYAEVQYKEDLKFNGSQMNFRYYDAAEGSGNLYGFSVSGADSLEQIWDVSDVTNAKKKVNKSGNNTSFNFGYLADNKTFNNEFVAFNSSSAYDPAFVGKIENQDLFGLQNVDYLIITIPEFIAEAERLAQYHRTKENFNAKVVDVNKIYNEFSSGSKDITAIRDFVTRLKNTTGNLKYLFILGDTSFDYKNRTPNNTDVVISYQSEDSGSYVTSFVTDDYFVMTKPQTSTRVTGNLPDLPVGRLTAANPTEAKNMIDKTLAYYNALPNQSTPFGDWRMKLDFVVDDDKDGMGANGGSPFHVTTNSALVSNFETNTDKPEYNIRKLYMDSFTAQMTAGGQRYPQVNQAITNDVGNSLFLLYFGHGGIYGWAQERVLSSLEVNNFNNFNAVYSRFPLVSTISCEFTLWDDPTTNSVGEQVSKRTTGGAATMITSSRAIDVSYGVYFSNIFINQIFKLYNDDFLPLGDAHLNAKKQLGANSNHMKVNFLGDPAMKLSRPQRLLAIDNIESPVAGQLRALDFVKVKGHINKTDGTLDNTFNGKVTINIFDKRLNKSTLNNDGILGVMAYTEEGSPIVKSSGQVTNGVFEVQFFVPKDINYDTGTGRILAYADNKSFDVFNNQAQTIGGINPDGINDNQPPKVQLFMNNTNFADGGITDQNPMLLACISDDKGINSTGSGVGHDITVFLDGKIVNTVVLNDFYTSGEGNGCVNATLADYQKGTVNYPFKNLSPGPHQLTFKVWDINNNSTTATLNFIVKDESSQNLVVNKLLNWPNPFTDKTYIQFEHNCDDLLEVNVQIFTITGKLVRTLTSSVTAEPFLQGYRTPRQAILWDGKDDFGDVVAKGTYIYKVLARSANQDKCKGSATAVEKMILLK